VFSRRWALAITLCALIFAGGCGGGDDERAPVPRASFDAERAMEDVRAQVAIGPRPTGSPGSRREVALIVGELRRAGLAPMVQAPLRNVVATIPGDRPGAVVVGAHHDTKDGIAGFVGANDGASGVAVVLEIGRALAARAGDEGRLRGPDVVLAFFDAEEPRGNRPFAEDGARGSRQFVELAAAGGGGGAPPLARLRAMYLLDMVGDCDLDIPRERNSDPELYSRLRGPAFGGERGPIGDDHLPFLEAGIPAVDVIDFSFGPGGSPGEWWHTPEDSLDKVCPASLRQAGAAVLAALEPPASGD
jgi:glutaminyl-peptide cyclotransferase